MSMSIQPNSNDFTDLADRLLPFEGVLNFRDLGGYPTEDGRRVKYGLLFRAAELTGMTDKDKELFRSLGIKTIFDYRGAQEAKAKPDPVLPGVTNMNLPAIADEVPTDLREMLQSGHLTNMLSADFLSKMYLDMAFGNPSFKRLMETAMNPDNLGLLHHCAGGRDRTGVGSAYILLALGVSGETIIEDYLISNRTLAPMNAAMKAQMAAYLSAEQTERLIAALELRRETMAALFSAIDERYGSVEAFLEQEFGMDAEKRKRFQDVCLETV
ncbi:tyrosine-protein phosphatase [Cohnella sp. REN36]|uniref:tyrosine-protein phosphatase n=1 Tax=Cohnella sp. REN36 TaxID=2887347 RepID=UPI001D158BF4|nr:tyrosine-protein phosphatase [Cohnella sp. REN36]MCC3374292.1 tyrosine-protein phosphatase [Cohnella sp. REN36]